MGTRSALSIVLAVVLVLAGCEAPYVLFVRFDQSVPRANGDVYIDGALAGYVESVDKASDNTLAKLIIKDVDAARSKFREGMSASARKDGGVDLYTSRAATTANPLASGSTIRAEGLLEAISGGNPLWFIVSAACWLMVLALVIRLFQAMLRLPAVVLPLLVALGVSYLYGALLTQFVRDTSAKFVARIAEQRKALATPAQPARAPVHSPVSTPTSTIPPIPKPGASDSQVPLDVVETLVQPEPKVTAYFLVCLVVFMAQEMFILLALPVLRRKASQGRAA